MSNALLLAAQLLVVCILMSMSSSHRGGLRKRLDQGQTGNAQSKRPDSQVAGGLRKRLKERNAEPADATKSSGVATTGKDFLQLA